MFSFHAEKSAASLPDIVLSDAHSCNPHFNFHLPPPTYQNCFSSHAWHRLVNRKVEQKIKRETERLMCPGGCCYLCLLSIPKVNDLVSCSTVWGCAVCMLHFPDLQVLRSFVPNGYAIVLFFHYKQHLLPRPLFASYYLFERSPLRIRWVKAVQLLWDLLLQPNNFVVLSLDVTKWPACTVARQVPCSKTYSELKRQNLKAWKAV